VKNKKRKFRILQRLTFPSEPEEISAIKKIIRKKQHKIISINFTLLFDNLAKQISHVVVVHIDVLNSRIKYFDSNLRELDLKPRAYNKEKKRFLEFQIALWQAKLPVSSSESFTTDMAILAVSLPPKSFPRFLIV